MKFLLICASFITLSITSVSGQCTNVYMYFIGNNLNDFKNTTTSTSFTALGNTYFNKALPTVFYTGGWVSNFSSFDAQVIFEAYLTKKSSYNLVYIDWYAYNKDIYFVPMVQNLECAAIQAAAIIAKLRGDYFFSISPNSFHFIGFNFGAHFMAYLSRSMKLLMPPYVGRITGLDPGAALGFTDLILARYAIKVLFWTDADLVDIIHTSAFKFGYGHAYGHVDFYPNGGRKQPDCSLMQSIKNFRQYQDLSHIYLLTCSHTRSVYLYAESVKRPAKSPLPFLTSRCKKDTFTDDSTSVYNPTTCDNLADGISMGFYAKNPPGINLDYAKRFYVETTNNSAKYSLT